MAGAQAKQIHDEIGLSGGLGEIGSRDGSVLECMWVEVEAVRMRSGLLATSTVPEGEFVVAHAQAMGDEGPQHVRHRRNLAVAWRG
jgi:hypothetical protein